jgi:hypothetical protein
MEIFNAKKWAIRLAFVVMIENRETWHMHAVKTVPVISNKQATI